MLASSPRSQIKLIMQPDTLLTTLRGLLFIVANSAVLMRPICCVSFGFRLFVNVSLWEPLNNGLLVRYLIFRPSTLLHVISSELSAF